MFCDAVQLLAKQAFSSFGAACYIHPWCHPPPCEQSLQSSALSLAPQQGERTKALTNLQPLWLLKGFCCMEGSAVR